MDPNQTLREIRALARRLDRGGWSSAEKAVAAGEELATLVQALDEWLSNLGFMPEAWAPKPVERCYCTPAARRLGHMAGCPRHKP